MGYFSNGTEGLDHEARSCDRCIHQDDPCAVTRAHMLHNYDECNKKESILHLLIQRLPDGSNGQCTMFKVKK